MHERPDSPAPPVARVAVVGASGSIGLAVCEALAGDYEVVALTRFESPAAAFGDGPPIDWRQCDLFARSRVEADLADCDVAIHLVHTRLPSARLDQAVCADMDLIIADNVARAARRQGIRQIICLRGLVPEGELPPPLAARRDEVVDTLAAYGTPVTVLRASLVVAPGSSSVNLIASAVDGAGIVPVPAWAAARKQPIALADVIRAVRLCIERPTLAGRSYDLGGPRVTDWRGILERAAGLLGQEPRFVALPWCPRRVYAWWLRRRSPKSHPALVRLLVEDLGYDSVAKDNALQSLIEPDASLPEAAIAPYLADGQRSRLANPRSALRPAYEAELRSARKVRSIQRMRLPQGRDASWLADHYFEWLGKIMRPFVACEVDESGTCDVVIRWPRIKLLQLSFRPDHSTPDRRMYFITGGVLADRERNNLGRMEFHDVLDGRFCIVAIHEFAPALPWNFYHFTQAVAHGFVMGLFQRHMNRLAK
jgi:nucleoside-diphosphate-sugar epimerase